MYSGVASVTLVAAPVRGPLVLVGLPWELTLVDEPLFVLFGIVPGSPDWFLMYVITKASEASWSYSCDSKVSFDWVQILTPDFSGRRPPPTHPPHPPPHSPLPTSPLPTSPFLLLVFLPSSLRPSLLPLRKFDSVLSSLFGMRLALRILRPHSLTLTLTLSLSHCLSHLSHLSHLFLISLISLSSLSLSSLSLVFPSLFSLFSRRRIRAKSHI